MKATGLKVLMSMIFSLVGNLVRVYIVYGIFVYVSLDMYVSLLNS